MAGEILQVDDVAAAFAGRGQRGDAKRVDGDKPAEPAFSPALTAKDVANGKIDCELPKNYFESPQVLECFIKLLTTMGRLKFTVIVERIEKGSVILHVVMHIDDARRLVRRMDKILVWSQRFRFGDRQAQEFAPGLAEFDVPIDQLPIPEKVLDAALAAFPYIMEVFFPETPFHEKLRWRNRGIRDRQPVLR